MTGRSIIATASSVHPCIVPMCSPRCHRSPPMRRSTCSRGSLVRDDALVHPALPPLLPYICCLSCSHFVVKHCSLFLLCLASYHTPSLPHPLLIFPLTMPLSRSSPHHSPCFALFLIFPLPCPLLVQYQGL